MKKIPKVFVNKIKKINNNKVVFYSLKDKDIDDTPIVDINSKINEIFKSMDFVYKRKVLIKTKDNEQEYTIISKSIDYLLTLNGKRIYFKDIIDIKMI